MSHKIAFKLLIVLLSSINIKAQTITILTSGTKTSLRGLSVVTDKIIWACGSNGTVAKSIDAGLTWKWITVKGFEKTDFRDIQAFNENTAVIMGIDSPAFILKTIDGGNNWKTVYRNDTKGIFLDAMDFDKNKNAVVVGDPINGKFFIARSKDAGDSWLEEPFLLRPIADSGEACFASSGSNILKLSNTKEILVSGGLSSHLFVNGKQLLLPMLQGKESTGANSIAAKNNKTFIVVGGDFTAKDSTTDICFYTNDAGKNWHPSSTPPSGYRSCIKYIKDNIWVTSGLNGVDITEDNGHKFRQISNDSFHVIGYSKKGKNIYLAGNKGTIGFLSIK